MTDYLEKLFNARNQGEEDFDNNKPAVPLPEYDAIMREEYLTGWRKAASKVTHVHSGKKETLDAIIINNT